MRSRKPKKRKAWLITWESSRDDYLNARQRPRVVAILKPQIGSSTIKTILPVLFIAASRLDFTEKIGHGLLKHQPSWLHQDLQFITFGNNPFLLARQVTDLYVETYEETLYHQTLHWTECPRYARDPDTYRIIEASPARQDSEDVHFDVLWYGKDFLEQDARANDKAANRGHYIMPSFE
jgi:hypothetical protein